MQTRLGVVAAAAAGIIWGIYPFFYKPLGNVDILEVISHRVIWSIALLSPLIFMNGEIRRSLSKLIFDQRKLFDVFVCATILMFWWLAYVYCLVNDMLLEASLGYFLGPVFTYAMAIFLLKEKIDLVSVVASVIAFGGVGYFVIVSGAGIPLFGLLLGLCYSSYTIFKRGFHTVGPRLSIFAEFTAMLPFAIIYLGVKASNGTLETFVSTTAVQNLLLFAIGLINVVPMWLYSFAARAVPSVTMSFLQFVSPTCNFFLAVVVYQEELTINHLIMFALVWIGVSIYAIAPAFKLSKSGRSE